MERFAYVCSGIGIFEDYKSSFPDYIVEDSSADDESGNCMFSATAHQLELHHYTSGMTGSTLRQQLVQYIKDNNTVKELVSSRLVNQSVDSYLQDMAKPGRWGDENFLYAAALRFNCTVCVLRSNGMETTYVGSSPSPSVSERVMLGYVSCVAGEAPNHYISLVAKQPVIKENAESNEKISKCRREDLPLPGQNSEADNSSSRTYDDQSQFSSDKLFKHFHQGKRHYVTCIPCSSCPHIVNN